MRFNDYATLSDQDYRLIKQNYDKILMEETRDLKDILSKMQSQRETFSKLNNDPKYHKFLVQLDKNIDELSTIISQNSNNYKTSEIPQIKGLFNNNPQSEEISHSPIRSKWEIENHNNTINDENNIINDDFGNIPPRTPSPAKPTNTLKRNSPLQSNFITNLFKKLNLNKNNKKESIAIKNNRFHNIITADCDDQTIMLSNQEEIIRLLLLYLLLKPNCRYLSRIASITLDQFSIYSILAHNN